MSAEVIAIVVSMILALFGGEWAFIGWQNRQFNSVRNLIYSENKQLRDDLLNKIEYHERHDDKRFADLHDDIWELRVQHAAAKVISRTDQYPDPKNPSTN